MRPRLRRDEGQVLALALVFLVFVALVLAATLTAAARNSRATQASTQQRDERYAAEAGILAAAGRSRDDLTRASAPILHPPGSTVASSPARTSSSTRCRWMWRALPRVAAVAPPKCRTRPRYSVLGVALLGPNEGVIASQRPEPANCSDRSDPVQSTCRLTCHAPPGRGSWLWASARAMHRLSRRPVGVRRRCRDLLARNVHSADRLPRLAAPGGSNRARTTSTSRQRTTRVDHRQQHHSRRRHPKANQWTPGHRPRCRERAGPQGSVHEGRRAVRLRRRFADAGRLDREGRVCAQPGTTEQQIAIYGMTPAADPQQQTLTQKPTIADSVSTPAYNPPHRGAGRGRRRSASVDPRKRRRRDHRQRLQHAARRVRSSSKRR